MKHLLICLFAFSSLTLIAQPWKTITGNGQLKKETREVSNFNSLSSHGSMDVQIAYGNTNSISIEADENLLQYIETTVENGKLTIRTTKNVNIKTKTKMVVYVSMTQISFLQQSGSGKISGDGNFTNDGQTNISIFGSGNIKLGFKSFKNLELSVSGSGNLDLKNGETNNISAQISGSGNLDCSDINSKDVDAKISGSGNLKVNASNSIYAKISGSGNIYYKGNATNINSKVVGSGRVTKI